MSSMKQISACEQDRFERLCTRTGVDDSVAAQVWSVLCQRYSETHRHYHTLDHVCAMLSALDGVAGSIDLDRGRFDLIEMAIWFHDIVYDPRSATNEADSAELFEKLVGEEMKDEDADVVQRLILATDPRNDRGDAKDEQILIDIDLLVLSADATGYQAYADAIRNEYAHVPEDAFATGRAEVLAGILKKQIYATDHFADRENLARVNLEAEIRVLSGK